MTPEVLFPAICVIVALVSYGAARAVKRWRGKRRTAELMKGIESIDIQAHWQRVIDEAKKR